MLLCRSAVLPGDGRRSRGARTIELSAFDPLAGFETRRLRVNQRYLQNTVEQIIVFAPALFGLAAYCSDGSSMRAVVATTVVWIVARAAFWLGYHRSAAMRGLGAPGMALSMIVLLYVTSRFGREIAGTAGAIVAACCIFRGRGRIVLGDAAGEGGMMRSTLPV